MRRILSIFLSAIMVFCIISFTPVFNVLAVDITSGDYICTDNGSTMSIIYYLGNSGVITIPSTLNGKPVTSIGDGAFSDRTILTSVTIPNSVTSIGVDAFLNCSNLTSVIIPNSVTSIGGNSFGFCSKLSNITIPSSIASISQGAFNNCTSLSNVVISQGVVGIVDYAFANCTSLTSVTIPNSVTSIGIYAFDRCDLTKLIIYCNVGSYSESYAINNLILHSNALATPTPVPTPTPTPMPVDGFTCSEDGTITEYTGVGGIVYIPNMINGKPVTSIGDGAFIDNDSITSVIIPSSVTVIGNYAFNVCTNLTSVAIPNSVTNIGTSAFDYCTSLTSATIPNSVIYIGIMAFYNCTSLSEINVDANNPMYCSTNGILCNKDGTTLIQYPAGKSGTSYIIPGNFTSIGDAAFACSTYLTDITIPNSITRIGTQVFGWCKNLTAITIPSSVTSIDASVFVSCKKASLVLYCEEDSYAKTFAINKVFTYQIVPTLGTITYNPTGKLSDITLPSEWVWNNVDIVPTADIRNYPATLTSKGKVVNLSLSVNKATPTYTLPTLSAITYSPTGKLSDTTLPLGWTWNNGTTVPTVNVSSYPATFTPTDTVNYNTINSNLSLSVNKATPIYTLPTLSAITYSPTGKLSDTTLPLGWSWNNGTTVPTVNVSSYPAIFTPIDTVNYNTVNSNVSLSVNKATPTYTLPTLSAITYSPTGKLSDTTLPLGWTWNNGTTVPTVNVSSYPAIFTPIDIVNYNTVNANIPLLVKKAVYSVSGIVGHLSGYYYDNPDNDPLMAEFQNAFGKATIELYDQNFENVLKSTTVEVTVNPGSLETLLVPFELADIEDGTYILAISRNGMCTKLISITISGGNLDIGTKLLLGTDINGDLEVTPNDVLAILAQFRAGDNDYGGANYSLIADVNADGSITPNDVLAVLNTFKHFNGYQEI